MLHRFKLTTRFIRRWFHRAPAPTMGDEAQAPAPFSSERTLAVLGRLRIIVLVVGGVGLLTYGILKYPPLRSIGQGEVGVRTNQVTGAVSQWRDGTVLVLPGLHEIKVTSLNDITYRPTQLQSATGSAPLQSVEGMSFGIDLAVRYALDPAKLAQTARTDPQSLTTEVVEPAVQGIVYKVFARYTVREAFSTKRAEIQQAIEAELKPRLAADGLLLKAVQVGKVDLPADYRRGMEGLLAEELASEKMRFTLELKDKRVRETELEANAEKVRREVQAEAAARELIIAAKGQEEAMKHVLPFKQRQIEQRQLEAEAEKQSRIRGAEGAAQARRIEANGEADARQKLAEVEAWRLDRIGKVNAEQMAREGALVTRHPLLIQKAMADKLSDKVQVIIAPPPASGGFIGDVLLGNARAATTKTGADNKANGAVEDKQED